MTAENKPYLAASNNTPAIDRPDGPCAGASVSSALNPGVPLAYLRGRHFITRRPTPLYSGSRNIRGAAHIRVRKLNDVDRFRVTNLLLNDLGRHSDHHVRPTRRPDEVEPRGDAPRLPAGYFTMFMVAPFRSCRRSAWRAPRMVDL